MLAVVGFVLGYGPLNSYVVGDFEHYLATHGQLRTHLKMRRRYRMFMNSKSRFARWARVIVFVGFDSFMKILAYCSQYAFPMFLIGCLLFAV